MSDEDDARLTLPRRARFPRRVTLKLEPMALSLPGESARDEGEAPGELALPADPSAADASAQDAWQRQRPRLTPPPFTPPTITALLEEVKDGYPIDALGGDALDLVDRRSRPPLPSADPIIEMSERYALGDYTAALVTAELILGRDPENETAKQIAESCRERLIALYRARIGALERVPDVAVDGPEVRWLGLDHRAAFLLSRVDGRSSVVEIVDMSGMSTLEALKTMVELLDIGALRFPD